MQIFLIKTFLWTLNISLHFVHNRHILFSSTWFCFIHLLQVGRRINGTLLFSFSTSRKISWCYPWFRIFNTSLVVRKFFFSSCRRTLKISIGKRTSFIKFFYVFVFLFYFPAKNFSNLSKLFKCCIFFLWYILFANYIFCFSFLF